MAYWIAATHRYVMTDTTDARGHRFGFSAEQRLRAGLHRLAATADLRLGRSSGGTAFGKTNVVATRAVLGGKRRHVPIIRSCH
jgi:hypothetical protein